MTSETMTPDQIIARVGQRFSEMLREAIGPEQFAEVQRRNAAEPRATVCHSHDFCDANEVMAAAMREVVGTAPYDDADASDEQTQGLVDIWNAAWTVAPDLRDAQVRKYGLPLEHQAGNHIFTDERTTLCGRTYSKVMWRDERPTVICQFCVSAEVGR